MGKLQILQIFQFKTVITFNPILAITFMGSSFVWLPCHSKWQGDIRDIAVLNGQYTVKEKYLSADFLIVDAPVQCASFYLERIELASKLR